jgi:hypothetical protein
VCGAITQDLQLLQVRRGTRGNLVTWTGAAAQDSGSRLGDAEHLQPSFVLFSEMLHKVSSFDLPRRPTTFGEVN